MDSVSACVTDYLDSNSSMGFPCNITDSIPEFDSGCSGAIPDMG